MLELKHITYTVSTPEGEQTILNDISIDIPDRKLIVFTGPNGGGKTTLAKVIMGLVTPTGGQILFNGQDITHLGITERAKLGISYGFQQPPRFKGITVRNLRVSAGAGFVVALTGDIMTMPGLPKSPAALRIDIDKDGTIAGLF